MPFSNFMIRWLMISFYYSNIIIIFISKGFWPSVSPSSISLLEDNDDDQLHSTIFKTARKSKLFFEIVLYRKSSGILGKIKLDSLVHLMLADVSMRIHDHWSHCPDNNEEGKFSAVCPADDDCPVSDKLHVLYPGLIWGSACLYYCILIWFRYEFWG